MFGLIKKILGERYEEKAKSSNTLLDADIALCVLLLEAAHVDGECSLEEKDHVALTLMTKCGISREKIDEFVARGDKERADSVDLFQFTRHMNNNLKKQEKMEVMEAVWRIIHIDGHLEKHEDHFAHKLANLLRLTHNELIDAKIKARMQLNDLTDLSVDGQ